MSALAAPAWLADVTPEALSEDPYPFYARLRAEAPVAWMEWAGAYFITRWEDCRRVGTDTAAFRGAEHHRTVNRVFGVPNILTAVDPEHGDLRAAVDPHLRPKQVTMYIDALARPIARRHLDGLTSDGAELMSAYFEPASVEALGDLLGLGVGPDVLRRWFHGLNAGISNRQGDPAAFAVAAAVTDDIETTLEPLLGRLERRPDDTLLSHMLHGGRPPGAPRDRTEVLPTLKVILLGGMQEPGHGAASTLLGLFGRREQLREVIADPSLVPAAVTEGLRWLAPIGSVEREALTEVEIAGVQLRPGDLVEVVMASANRDERRFERPDEFDIHRTRQSHMAFGNGDHFCSGHFFSRQLERIMLEELFAARPSLALDPDRPPAVTGWNFRAPKQLHVRFSA